MRKNLLSRSLLVFSTCMVALLCSNNLHAQTEKERITRKVRPDKPVVYTPSVQKLKPAPRSPRRNTSSADSSRIKVIERGKPVPASIKKPAAISG